MEPPSDQGAGARENFKQIRADALDSLSSLVNGLDVNIRFTDVAGYEFTATTTIFDLLGVS